MDLYDLFQSTGAPLFNRFLAHADTYGGMLPGIVVGQHSDGTGYLSLGVRTRTLAGAAAWVAADEELRCFADPTARRWVRRTLDHDGSGMTMYCLDDGIVHVSVSCFDDERDAVQTPRDDSPDVRV